MKPYCRCRGWIHSVNVSQNDYQMGRHPQHEADLFICLKRLYKYIKDANQKFLALIIPKAWKYTVLVEAHDKLRHQGVTHTYCLIKHQYYWKGMNKDIWKYTANCTLCPWEKAKVQSYPLQMTEILERSFNKNCHWLGNGMWNILIRQ